MSKTIYSKPLTEIYFNVRRFLTVLLLILTPALSFSQVDSLKNLIRTSKDDSEIARNYNLLADLFLDVDADLSRKYADSAKLIGEKIFDFKIISDSYVNYANSYFFKGKLDSALFYFERSYHTILRTRNTNEIAASLNRLGLIYESKSDFSKAAEYYYKALNIYEETQHLKGIAEIYNNIGVINDAMGQVDEAIANYRKSLVQFENANFIEGQANVYNNLATHYANRSQFDTAIIYINNAIVILESKNRNTEAATAYLNASTFYNMMEQDDSASLCLDSALVKYNKTNNIHGIANVYNQQAKVMFLNKDYKGAIDVLLKSLEIRQEVGNLNAESITLSQLSDYYYASGDYYNSLKYYKEYILLRDSVFDSSTKTMISELNIKYETEKKDKEITILRNEAEIKRTHNRTLIFLSVSLAIISVLLFYFFRIKTRLLSSQRKYFEQQETVNKLELEKQETERELLEQEVKTQQQINELQKKRF
ncbi:MAG: hypothetical protein C0596_01560 [Marinilabiliales bacterium]|nr:MAG: hypothetical protein C0596_01560 [Marinilabiliales bacterium]